jgi:hypothetical protein
VPGTAKREFAGLLIELSRHAVDFIVVGGVAAVLEGLDAVYRMSPEQKLKPAASHLTSPGHQLLITRLGPLDILGSIGRSRCYDDLLPHTSEIEVGKGLRVPVLNLEMLIVVKEEVAGEKDRAVLPVMRRTLEEKRRSR